MRSRRNKRSQLTRVAFLLLVVGGACAGTGSGACGSRTGLFIDDSFSLLPGGDAGADIGPDGRRDGTTVEDAPPPLDVKPPVDVDRRDCPDAEATLVYTITDTYDLQSFNPDTGQFKLIGKITCPAPPNTPSGQPNSPFSMAVDRKGIAFILFRDERLYRVSTATGACIGTAYTPRQSNFGLFGMGFATNSVGPTEALYVSGDDEQTSPGVPDMAGGLARITPGTFDLNAVGDYSPPINAAELTGTGDGRLFGFYRKENDNLEPPTFIGEIDTDSAKIVGERRFDNIIQGNAWAFAFWGGDFYMFHAPTTGTLVTRWRPSDDSVTQVATTNLKIVGAGVSTCAPQN